MCLIGSTSASCQSSDRVYALIGFMQSVWMCEDQDHVHGVDIGRGKFHFNFTDEADLKAVLEKRPYHFDQWMHAIERWVASVRDDFPATIPFWIKIVGLLVHCCLEGPVKEIGEELDELVAWDVLECGARM